MDEIREGDWLVLDSHQYFSYHLSNGTVGYADIVSDKQINFRPIRHPEGKSISVNSRWISKEHFKKLNIELSEKELDDLIDLALVVKDERMFKELWNRRYLTQTVR